MKTTLKMLTPERVKNNELWNDLVGKSVCIYPNALLQKESVLTENRGKSGVYLWTNKENGKSYIGSAVDLGRRFSEYYSKKFLVKSLTRGKSRIYQSLLKNGYLNFQLEILVYCEAEDAVNGLVEQKFIDLLKPEYNLCKIAGSSLGRITTEETRKRLRTVRLIREYLKSPKHSAETLLEYKLLNLEKVLKKLEYRISKLQNTVEKIIALQSESKKSMEIRENKLAASPTAITIEVIDLVAGVTTIFASARRAGEFLNASNSTIMNKLKGKNNKPYKERFIIKRHET